MATVYFNPDVKDHPDFLSEPDRSSTKPGARVTSIKGMYFSAQSTPRPYIFFDLDATMPDDLKKYVVDIEVGVQIARVVSRETGIYELGTATAEVLIYPDHKLPQYSIRLHGKELDDIRKLLHAIKAGAIRPAHSYECRQSGMSRAELEAGLTHEKGRVATLEDELETRQAFSDDLQRKFTNLKGIVETILDSMQEKWFKSRSTQETIFQIKAAIGRKY